MLNDLRRRLDPLARPKSPLSAPPPRSTRFGSPLVLSRVHWVEPKLVVEITYLTWTADNLLRQTVYVSEITHRIMSPGRFIREAKQVSFRVSEKVSHGFFPVLFNHRISQSRLPIYAKLERFGERVTPGMGANFIVCLEK